VAISLVFVLPVSCLYLTQQMIAVVVFNLYMYIVDPLGRQFVYVDKINVRGKDFKMLSLFSKEKRDYKLKFNFYVKNKYLKTF